MPQKFNVQTADREALVERVTQLTSALVKQKDNIAKSKAKEDALLAENEKLQRQIRLLTEEGEMGRQLRGELQGEVARLQRSLDLLTAEMQMHQQNEKECSLLSKKSSSVNIEDDECSNTKNGDVLSNSLSCQSQTEASVESQKASKNGKTESTLRAQMEAANAFIMKMSTQFKKDTKDSNGSGGTDPEVAAGPAEASESADSFDEAKRSDEANVLEVQDAQAQVDGCANAQLSQTGESTEIARLQLQLASSEEARLKAEERLEATRAAYFQAKKYAEDLQQTIETKEKEIESLRKAAQRREDVDIAEMRRREQDAARISALETVVASKESELKAAEDKLAPLIRENHALQHNLKTAHSAAQERMATALAAARRLEEREAQMRKEVEAAKANTEALRAQLKAVEEEKERQLQQDKLIIRKLQAEGRARTTELESRIAGLEAMLHSGSGDHSQGFLGAAPPDETVSEHDCSRRSAVEEEEASSPAANRDSNSAAVLTLTPIPLSAAGLRTPGEAVASPACGADSPMVSGAGGGGMWRREEDLIRRSLRAIEDLIEVLMLRREIAGRLDKELQDLEAHLDAGSHLDALASVAMRVVMCNTCLSRAGMQERRVDALCGLTQIAADYLQELPWADLEVQYLGHHSSGPSSRSGPFTAASARVRDIALWAATTAAGLADSAARAAGLGPCWRGERVGSTAYAPVRSAGDYEDGL